VKNSSMGRNAINALYSMLSVAMCLYAGAPANAQVRPEGAPPVQSTIQSTKGLVLKHRVPVSRELIRVKLPEPQEVKLKNGLRVLLLEHHKVPQFAARMVVMSGGLSDPPDQRGVAQFTANLLREGTAKRTSRQIAEQIDSIAAQLSGNAGVTSFMSFVTAAGGTEDLDQILDIFADVILHPSFPPDEVKKYLARNVSIEEILRSDPGFLAQERLYKAIYGDHPAGTIAFPLEALKKTTSEDLRKFHATHYRPNNAVLLVVGDVTLKEFMPRIEKLFGDWEPGPIPKVVVPEVRSQSKSQVHLVDRPDSVQTVLNLGNLGIPRVHPDYFPLLVMDRILGGPLGRLFLNLREDKGYTYGVGSFFTGSNFPGIWLTTSSVRTEATEGAMREFMYELKRIRDGLVTEEELENAKRAIIGRFALSLELPQLLLQNIFTREIFHLENDYWVTYPNKVAAVTREDVQRAARKYINLENLQIIAVGDASKINKILEQYGPVRTDEPK
jgi:zinc protease